MNFLDLVIIIPSYLSGIIFGLLFGRIFIDITVNKRFRLTRIGTKLFGKKTGFKSQFTKSIKGAFLVIFDLVIIAITSNLIEEGVRVIMKNNPNFYIPFTLFVFLTTYTLIRRTTKISKIEWFIIILIYLIVIGIGYLIFKY